MKYVALLGVLLMTVAIPASKGRAVDKAVGNAMDNVEDEADVDGKKQRTENLGAKVVDKRYFLMFFICPKGLCTRMIPSL